jgi:drug/metabolite transporter (DMT)-like permease
MIAAALAAVYLIWGSTYYAIRVTLESLPPFTMAGARFLLAGSVLWTIQRLRGKPAPDAAQARSAAVIGLLLLLGGNGAVVYAEQSIGSGLVALIVGSVPVMTGLFGGLFGRSPSNREWAGIGVGLAGIALLSLDGSLRATPLGLLALAGGTISWSFGSIWSRQLRMPVGLDAAAIEMLAGGVGMMVLGAVCHEHVHMPTGRSIAAFVYLLVFGSLIAFSAYVFLLERTRPAVSSSYAYVNPVVALAIGAGTGEHVRPIHVAALAVVLAGVAIMARESARRSRG